MIISHVLKSFKALASKEQALSKARKQSRIGQLETLERRELLSTMGGNSFDHQIGHAMHPGEFSIASSIPSGHNQNSPQVRSGRLSTQTSVTYYDTSSVSIQPVNGWQGIRPTAKKNQYLLTGTSAANGLLTIGAITGVGNSYLVQFPNAYNTSVYGPNLLNHGKIQLVGAYKLPDYSTSDVKVHGFVWTGKTSDLPTGGHYQTIDYPGAEFTYVHSTMGGLAVGNADGPTSSGAPLGPGTAFIYNIAKAKFVSNIVFPGSISDTAYGIWQNSKNSYTIVGGYSNLPVNNMNNQSEPIGTAYAVDYNSATRKFSHWTSFNYPSGVNLVSHFEGISVAKNGVYSLAAVTAQAGTGDLVGGSFVTVRRNANGTFGVPTWTNLQYPGSINVSTNDSVAGNKAVGIVIKSSGTISYQASLNK